MEDNCAAGSIYMLPSSQPVPVLQTPANMAPNKGDMESSDLNITHSHPMLDGNVSAPKMPSAHSTQQAKGESNNQGKPPFHHESDNDQDTPMLECYKQDFSFRLEITPATEMTELINNTDGQSQTVSPILEQFDIVRPTTPPTKIPPVTDIFSPNTVNEFRSTLFSLFPNGPPPPQPVVPVKKHKKGDPYIVGCTKRRRVPEKKTLNVFKGDKYGITKDTNTFDNEECPAKRKRGKVNQYPNWSKSRFNPKSEEIAAKLKRNENVDAMSRKSPNNDRNATVSFMSKPYTPRPQAFSPLPSTSKDNETIMKNEKHFSESLRYRNFDVCDDDDDDAELPDIQLGSKNIDKPKRRSLFQSRDLDLISNEEPSVKSEDLNINNNISPNEVDLREIQFDKYLPKKEYPVPITTTNNDPVIIDEIDLDNVIEASEPKRVLGEIQEVIETHDIKDDYSSITYEDLYLVPKITEPVDVDEFFKEVEIFEQRKKKVRHNIITIVDPANIETSHFKKPLAYSVPKQVSHNNNPAVNLVSTQEPLVNVEARTTTPETAEVIEIPDYAQATNHSTRQGSSSDVEFVSETVGDKNNPRNDNLTNDDPTDDDNDLGSVVAQHFIADSMRNFHNTRRRRKSQVPEAGILYPLLQFLSEYDRPTNRFSQPQTRSKKAKKSPNAQPQKPTTVNNENAVPSMNGETPTNEERRLGDCPICMENLARGSIASTTCGHVFCLDCIKKCLRTNGKKCPTCRKTLKGPGYHSIFL